MDPKIFNFTFKDLAISKEEVVRVIHGGEEDESHQYYIDILAQEFLQLNGYSDIRGGYIETSEVDFDITNKTIKVSEAEFNVGKMSNRYSPGYCNWNVAEQHKLFKLLPKDFCGVSLTESVLMQPIKSISGFIGVGEKIKYHHYKCKFCTQKQCIYKSKFPKV